VASARGSENGGGRGRTGSAALASAIIRGRSPPLPRNASKILSAPPLVPVTVIYLYLLLLFIYFYLFISNNTYNQVS
jgi:hypothetical protein